MRQTGHSKALSSGEVNWASYPGMIPLLALLEVGTQPQIFVTSTQYERKTQRGLTNTD